MRCLGPLALLAAVLLAGCGGGSGSSSSGPNASVSVTAPASASATSTESPSPPPAVSHKVAQAQPQFGPASAVPHVKGGDNSIQDFGQEASQADRAAAARSLTAYLTAISRGDAKTACALLASSATQQVQQSGSSAAGTGCPALVGRIAASMPAQLKGQLRGARVLSVRVSGDHGFIIFDGVGPKVSNMPLVKEGGQWKVAAVGPIPLQY